MGIFVIVVSVLLLSCGVRSFTISDKDYENIEKMLDFGAQVLLNCLDRVRDITERMVRDNQLRKNRVAIQDHWNSFKETANRISVEERGNGEQDDLLVAARTVQRLVTIYKDDVQRTIHSLASTKSIHQYLPAVNMLQGVIERERLNEVWGDVESHYFPGAPSVKNDPLEFLCYLLTTRIRNLNIGDAVSEMRKLPEKLQSAVDAIGKKATEFTDLERQNETDDLLVSVSAAARVVIFYWDRFLEYTESPEFSMEGRQTEGVFETFRETMEEMEGIGRSLVESNLFMDIFGLLSVYLQGVDRVFSMPYDPFMVMGDSTRAMRTSSALSTVGMIVGARVWEKIYEIEMFPIIKQCYLRTLDMTYVLVGEADFETFRGVVFQHWRPFRDEAHRVLEEERRNITVFWLPPVRAGVRLLQTYSNKLANENVDDSGTKHLAKSFDKIRTFYTEKLLTSGIVTQKELDEFQRIFVGEVSRLLHLAGEHEIRGCVWNLYKASLVFINVTSSRLTESWNFISV